MTQILFKIGLLAAILSAIAVFIASMPDAQPMPVFISSTINWFFSSMYWFDPILDVPVFFQCVYILASATIWFFLALGFIKVIRWAIIAAV